MTVPQTPSPWSSLTLITSAIVFLLVYLGWQQWRTLPPVFEEIPAGDARKTAFFAYLTPLVNQENAQVQKDRDRLAEVEQRLQNPLIRKGERRWLSSLALDYREPDIKPTTELVQNLLLKVDRIPTSLVLAQAAKESGWGTSRFASEGHNYFGQRCFSDGCGMIPHQRNQAERYEVARFSSTAESVASYINNLNRHPEYAALRQYRAQLRESGVAISGIKLAEKLTQYSQRRQDYVDELQSLIHFNKLDALP